MRATALSLGAPAGAVRTVIRRVGDEVEMVNLRWGLRSLHADDAAGQRFVRSEGRTFPSHRCLVPVSEFQVVKDGRPYAVALEDGNWFYLAGVWHPAKGAWPEAFAVITVDATREVARYQPRQGAFIRRNGHMAWLDQLEPEADILKSPPSGIFAIRPLGSGVQGNLRL